MGLRCSGAVGHPRALCRELVLEETARIECPGRRAAFQGCAGRGCRPGVDAGDANKVVDVGARMAGHAGSRALRRPSDAIAAADGMGRRAARRADAVSANAAANASSVAAAHALLGTTALLGADALHRTDAASSNAAANDALLGAAVRLPGAALLGADTAGLGDDATLPGADAAAATVRGSDADLTQIAQLLCAHGHTSTTDATVTAAATTTIPGRFAAADGAEGCLRAGGRKPRW